MHSKIPSRSLLLRGLTVVMVTLVAGVALGHFAWTAAKILRLSPAPGRSFKRSNSNYFSPGSRSSGYPGASGYESESRYGPESGYGSSRSLFGGTAETGSSGESSVSSSVTSKIDPALVDINTNLGLEDGEAAGTGMVITSSGEVLTNNHVITGATQITAKDIGNGKTYVAHVVGYDRSQDVAVLALDDASGLQTVALSSSGLPAVGEGVASIGNAGGRGGTPSAAGGSVTAVEKSITAGDELDGSSEHLTGLIEIDGGLEPGDSGGPLVNSSGEVVGMDTAASQTFEFESSAHQGFAIPIEAVQTLAKEILEGKDSSAIHLGATGMLGVFIEGEGSEGAVVESVISNTAASGTNLSPGDRITSLDGSSVTSPTSLTDLILQKHPGESVEVTWQTTGSSQESATVKLGSGPPQ